MKKFTLLGLKSCLGLPNYVLLLHAPRGTSTSQNELWRQLAVFFKACN